MTKLSWTKDMLSTMHDNIVSVNSRIFGPSEHSKHPNLRHGTCTGRTEKEVYHTKKGTHDEATQRMDLARRIDQHDDFVGL